MTSPSPGSRSFDFPSLSVPRGVPLSFHDDRFLEALSTNGKGTQCRQNCMLHRVGLRLLSGERNEPPQPEYFDARWGFMRSLPCPQGYVWISIKLWICGHRIRLVWGPVPVGRARLKIVLVTFGAQSPIFRHFFSRTFPPVYSTTFTTDLRVRSSSTANTRTHESVRSRVGQIATARATRSAARRNLRHSPRTFARRTRVRAALTSCGQRARAEPVSRRYLAVSHRYLTGISSFLSPSGRRCTAAGARSHSPCGP